MIGVVDTNNPLINVDYPIPGNDDAIRAIQLYVTAVADTINEARATITNHSGAAEESAEEEVEEEVVVAADLDDEADQD